MLPLIGERQCQELVDGIGCLGAEPLQHGLAAAARTQNLGIELERRREIGAGEQRPQPLMHFAQPRMLGRQPAQARPQLLLAAVVGQEEQLVLGDAEQRAFQHRRQRQVVLGQQQELAERDQVLHRQLFGQGQPVGAGHRHAALLQRPHQVGDKGVTAAHQHHDVAGAQRPAARLQPLAVPQPALDRRGDGASQPGARLGLAARRGDPGRRGIRFGFRIGGDRRP